MVWHVLLVRRRGVVPPIDAVADRPSRQAVAGSRRPCHDRPQSQQPSADIAAQEWKGPWRRYDIVKEGVIAIVVVSILTVLLAGHVQLTRRAAADVPGLGGERPGQLLRHRGPGTGRHQRVRRLRPAVQHRRRRDRPSDRWPRRSGSASRIRSTRPTTSSSRHCAPSSSPPTSAAALQALGRGRAPTSRPPGRPTTTPR